MGDIIDGHYDGSDDSVAGIRAALRNYSDIIDGWAGRVANNFVTDLNRQNESEWRKRSQDIGRELQQIIDNTPVGGVMRSIVNEQVKYIKSLPLEAADRVQDIHNRAVEAVMQGIRQETFAQEIHNSTGVAMSRANLIARTETGRAAGALDQARALAAGSPGYIWRVVGDGDTRHSHLMMEGEFVPWDKPPTLDGLTGHAGELPNCRCWKDIVFRNPTGKS